MALNTFNTPEFYTVHYYTRSGELHRTRFVARSFKEAVAQAATSHEAVRVITTVGGETTPVNEVLLRR